MSRTYKDNIHLIRKHKPASLLQLFTSDICQHHLIGTSGQRKANIWSKTERKKAGHYRKGEPKTTTKYEPVFAHEITEDMELFHSYATNGELIYYKLVTTTIETREWVPNENYEPSYIQWEYEDHCTLEEFKEDARSNWKDFFNQKTEEGKIMPCFQSISYRYWVSSLKKAERKEYQDKHRAKARTADKHLTKLYNSGENLEDYDWEDPHYPMHSAWW